METTYKYVIGGAGLAGCNAIDGLRAVDSKGTILLIGGENYLPYNRPPLSKSLWSGKKKVEEIFVRDKDFFLRNNVDIALNTKVTAVDSANKFVICTDGKTFKYEKLLLATGGNPRRLTITGGILSEIYYFRYLDDYLRLKSQVHDGMHVLVIGGGFIGSEIAAALNISKASVTMLVKEDFLVEHIFPRTLAESIQKDYIRRGVNILADDTAVSIKKEGKEIVTLTKNGQEIISDIIVAGIGIEPETQLAKSAGLKIDNGIVVNEFLQSSSPDIYAAGDNANFPYQALDRRMRVEHWDNAVNQGKFAGMNMAGEKTAYTYMPYFFSDLFDFGYEAVGIVSSKLETFADWQKENETGVIYYLEGGFVRGIMMCNVWGKVDAARELIRRNEKIPASRLAGAIK